MSLWRGSVDRTLPVQHLCVNVLGALIDSHVHEVQFNLDVHAESEIGVAPRMLNSWVEAIQSSSQEAVNIKFHTAKSSGHITG